MIEWPANYDPLDSSSECGDNQCALPCPRRILCLSFTHRSCLYVREAGLLKVNLLPDSKQWYQNYTVTNFRNSHCTKDAGMHPLCPAHFLSSVMLMYSPHCNTCQKCSPLEKNLWPIFCLIFWDKRILTWKSRVQRHIHILRLTKLPFVNLSETVSTALVYMMKKCTIRSRRDWSRKTSWKD